MPAPINILTSGLSLEGISYNLRIGFNIWVTQNTITIDIIMLDDTGKFTEIIAKISYLVDFVDYMGDIVTL